MKTKSAQSPSCSPQLVSRPKEQDTAEPSAKLSRSNSRSTGSRWPSGVDLLKATATLLLASRGAAATAGPARPLYVNGKNIDYLNGGRYDQLIGLNAVDTHACGVYGHQQVSANAQRKILDFAAANINFGMVRYDLEFDAVSRNGSDALSLANQVQHFDYLGNTLGKNVLVAPWITPSELTDGAPTPHTDALLTALSTLAKTRPWMLIGVGNENHPNNPSAATDEAIRRRMQHAIHTIRRTTPDTLISVGTPRNYDADVSLAYEAQPLQDPQHPANPQILYALHLYGPPARVTQTLAAVQSSSLPYFIEEAGPTGENVEGQGPTANGMTYAGFCSLLTQARAQQLVVLPWVLGPRDCAPSMTRPRANSVPLQGDVELTPWGQMVAQASQTGVCVVPPPAPPTAPQLSPPPAPGAPGTKSTSSAPGPVASGTASVASRAPLASLLVGTGVAAALVLV
jgi:hypothetical protein